MKSFATLALLLVASWSFAAAPVKPQVKKPAVVKAKPNQAGVLNNKAKPDGENGQKDDGQQGQNDDGQKNQKDDGQQNNKDDGQKNQKDDGQQGQNGNNNELKGNKK